MTERLSDDRLAELAEGCFRGSCGAGTRYPSIEEIVALALEAQTARQLVYRSGLFAGFGPAVARRVQETERRSR